MTRHPKVLWLAGIAPEGPICTNDEGVAKPVKLTRVEDPIPLYFSDDKKYTVRCKEKNEKPFGVFRGHGPLGGATVTYMYCVARHEESALFFLSGVVGMLTLLEGTLGNLAFLKNQALRMPAMRVPSEEEPK